MIQFLGNCAFAGVRVYIGFFIYDRYDTQLVHNVFEVMCCTGSLLSLPPNVENLQISRYSD